MTAKGPETGELLAKLLAKAVDGPAALARAVAVATLTVAECIASLLDQGMAEDIHCIKDSLVRKAKAEGDIAEAEAKKRLAEATEAAHRVTLRKRNKAIKQAEQAQLEATATKTEAEADATLMDAETRRQQAETESQARLIEAKARFIEAVTKLRQEGGDIFFDRDNLRKILDAGPPPEAEQEDSGPAEPEQADQT